MMVDILVPLGALTIVLLLVAQVRSLIEQAMLNRTIRKAMEIDPASVPVLADKLGARQVPDALLGWITLFAGVGLGVAALFAEVDERGEIIQVAVIAVAIGAGILAFARWAGRRP